MTSQDERGQSPLRSPVVLSGLIIGLVVGLLAVSLARLRDAEERSHLALVTTADALAHARYLTALEWEAIAEQSSQPVADEYARAKQQFLRDIAEVDDRAGTLAVSAQVFLDAVEREFAAIDKGDLEAAKEIDESEVDPAADILLADLEASAASHREIADSMERVTGLLSSAILGLAAIVLAVFWSITLRHRERRQADALEERFNQRTKAVIESSSDLFTVVSSLDEVAVLSSDLRSLTSFAPSPNPLSMQELLPKPAYASWLRADELVRREGGHQRFEVSLQSPDGFTHLEAHGSAVSSSRSERVWVWRNVTQRKELELQLAHDALHDSLTGVANRSLLLDRTDHALKMASRSERPVSLLFGDLDGFKAVNDSLGHQQGDELLKIVISRISSCLRAGDTLARLGGDEFAVLLEDTDADGAAELAQRILRAVSHQVDFGTRVFFPSISIGVTTADPDSTSGELLRQADLAMYSAKRSGRGRSITFQDDMDKSVEMAFELAAELKRALAYGEFTLHYQPTVDLQSGNVEGVEALIRWTHPVRGVVRPDEFIPIAEANGLIVPIGKWVLEEACRAAAELHAQDGVAYMMSVNLSPQQLRDPDIVQTVSDALTKAELDPELLVLEITEGSLLEDSSAIGRLHDLRALGIQIAVDDFGTGYTSINYLQNLPISILKIDRSFVSGGALHAEERRAFLSAIVGLAQSLSLRSVAEGIESQAELDELKDLGCTTGQGFLWSPARPQATISETIANLEKLRPSQTSPRAH